MDDLFGLIVIIIGIAAGIYSDKKKKEGKQKKAADILLADPARYFFFSIFRRLKFN